MATNATARNFRVAYLEQPTPGVVPASAFKLMRITGFTHTPQFQSVESAEIQLGETPDLVRVGVDGTITISGELSFGAIDDFLPGAFFADWATNVLKVGSTKKFFIVEAQHLDIGKYVTYQNCIVTDIKLNTVQRAKLTFDITLAVGLLPTASTTVSAGTGAATAAPTNPIFSPVKSIQLAQEGGTGSLLTVGLTAFSLEFNRGFIAEPQLGSLSPSDIDGDAFTAKGSFSCYLPDMALFDKILADTSTSLAYTLGGASAQKYAFLLTLVKLASGGPDAAAKSKAFIQTYAFQALYDATNSTTKITRTP